MAKWYEIKAAAPVAEGEAPKPAELLIYGNIGDRWNEDGVVASELVREVGMDWMSQDLAARLSTRAAQGIGAGLLTARLGIKAMELCRPLPWIDDDKPRLGDFRRQLIGQVKETLHKDKTPSEK